MNDIAPYFTAKSLAKIFNVDRNTIYRWIKQGMLPSGFKYGSRRLWKKEELVNHSEQLAQIFSTGD